MTLNAIGSICDTVCHNCFNFCFVGKLFDCDCSKNQTTVVFGQVAPDQIERVRARDRVSDRRKGERQAGHERETIGMREGGAPARPRAGLPRVGTLGGLRDQSLDDLGAEAVDALFAGIAARVP